MNNDIDFKLFRKKKNISILFLIYFSICSQNQSFAQQNQSTFGDCSPNIVGNNNIVTCKDGGTIRPLVTIDRALRAIVREQGRIAHADSRCRTSFRDDRSGRDGFEPPRNEEAYNWRCVTYARAADENVPFEIVRNTANLNESVYRLDHPMPERGRMLFFSILSSYLHNERQNFAPGNGVNNTIILRSPVRRFHLFFLAFFHATRNQCVAAVRAFDMLEREPDVQSSFSLESRQSLRVVVDNCGSR